MSDEFDILELLSRIPPGFRLNVTSTLHGGAINVVPVGEIARLAKEEIVLLRTNLSPKPTDLTVAQLLAAARKAEDRINADIGK